ncbi:MAG: DegT/DnrJ/EryC1/StrS family aminotransferase [Proteobacteria bacterium]|nr:DegT/DnrJ/EryC1/StrS family aminotransferase [Pseudomonadota bacterium]
MAIPFVDLQAQYQALEKEINARIQHVLGHGNYIMGPEVGELETKLAEYVGVKHAVGCASGTDALLLPLMALGVGSGDAVFTTPFTFIATAEVISLLGATPVFVDIDPVTCNLDPARLDLAIRAVESNDPSLHPLPRAPRLTPKGVIAVDLYGLPADYEALQAVSSEHGLFLLEDGAQSFGAEYRGKRACAFGDAAATSFFPAKPLGCYGDGGMAFTDRDDLAEAMRSIRIHGKGRDKYDNVRIGLNARLDTIQAAILLAKFEAFPGEVDRRRQLARSYTEILSRSSSLVPPHVPEGYRSAWAQYTVRAAPGRRGAAQEAFTKAGIPTAVYYPQPLHLQGAFKPLGYRQGDFPEAELASGEVLSLPFGPYANDDVALRIAETAP